MAAFKNIAEPQNSIRVGGDHRDNGFFLTININDKNLVIQMSKSTMKMAAFKNIAEPQNSI